MPVDQPKHHCWDIEVLAAYSSPKEQYSFRLSSRVSSVPKLQFTGENGKHQGGSSHHTAHGAHTSTAAKAP